MNIKEFISTPNWAIKLSKMAYGPRTMIENHLIFQTPFLPQTATILQRAWHIKNEVMTVPHCKMCNHPVKFQKTNKYATYCSVKCSRKSPDVHKKKLQTEINQCGGKEEFQQKKVNDFKKISQDLYGVDNISQSTSVKSKIKKKRSPTKKGED